MIIGALDPDAWAGLVLSDRPGRGFAFRWAIVRNGERADGPDLLYLVHDIGPNAPDGSYARIAFDPSLPFGQREATPVLEKTDRDPGLILEWARTGHGAVVRATARFHGVLEFVAYYPWDWGGTWQALGEGLEGRTEDGEWWCALATDPAPTGRALADSVATLQFPVEPGRVIHLALSTSERPHRAGVVDRDGIATALAAAERAYAARRVGAEGHWHDLPAAIADNLHWMVCLQPETGRRYAPAGRRWIFPRAGDGREHWTVFAWDTFFNALELSLESPELARETLETVLATQFGNGCVPNWRGRYFGTRDRSQPPIGAFCALKLALRTGDRELLAQAFPALKRWHAWWTTPKGGRPRRDGNQNGLCEWGSDADELHESPASWENTASGHQRAAWESGQDDLPNWDDAYWNIDTDTLELDAVDLNSYLALDAECLGLIAATLRDQTAADGYRTRAEEIRHLMNEALWDEELGLYLDRHWDGRRSTRVAASNFLPLLAGVPSADQAARMVETLLDPARFWGRFMLPTISRDDPAFADQQYWRGSIWPPTNYLVCQGLRRYGFDEAAAELAHRSVDLFLGSWRAYRLSRENYDARTGAGGGHRYQSWGPLFALLGVEEFVDVTPWDGLRFGSLRAPPTTVLRRVPAAGRAWTVTLGPNQTRVEVDGALVLATDCPVVARGVMIGDGRRVAASVTTRRRCTLHTPEADQDLEPGTHGVEFSLDRK